MTCRDLNAGKSYICVADDISLFKKMRNEISVDDLEDVQAKKLFITLEECSRSESFSVSSILTRCDNDEIRDLIIQSSNEYQGQEAKAVDDSIKLIKSRKLKRQSEEILNRIRRLERSSLVEDQNQLKDLVIQRQEISKQIEMLKG